MPAAKGAASLLRMQQPSAAGCWLPCALRAAMKNRFEGAKGAPGSLKSMPIEASILPGSGVVLDHRPGTSPGQQPLFWANDFDEVAGPERLK